MAAAKKPTTARRRRKPRLKAAAEAYLELFTLNWRITGDPSDAPAAWRASEWAEMNSRAPTQAASA